MESTVVTSSDIFMAVRLRLGPSRCACCPHERLQAHRFVGTLNLKAETSL